MPADSRECRKHAAHCAELAQAATTPRDMSLLIQLSQNWLKLASELERRQTVGG
jgi:hypothetical protein